MPSATLERILKEVKRLTPEERRELREVLEREAVCAVVLPSAGVDNDRWEREQRWLDEHREEYLGQGGRSRATVCWRAVGTGGPCTRRRARQASVPPS